ncbi:MAG: FCD domain-containing protein, partial [Rhodospirillaceae bacterium]
MKQLSLTEHTLNELREAILRIDHEPGSALRLDALQKQYGTSSSPLREALNRLVSEGLVTQDSNRGFRVATISLDEFRDMTEMRLLLEPEALRRSIEYGDDEWEGRVIAAHHRLRRAEEGKTSISPTLDEDWSTVHRAFHLELFSGGPSLRLQKQCASLFTEAERYRRVTARLRQRPRDKGAEHAAIMAAALDRDSGLAVTLLRNHIQSTAD